MSLEQALQRCRHASLQLNKKKCLFRLTYIPFFEKVISRHRVSPDLPKVMALTDIPPPKTQRELKSFWGIVNYLSKFSPMTAELCKPLRRLTSVNAA